MNKNYRNPFPCPDYDPEYNEDDCIFDISTFTGYLESEMPGMAGEPMTILEFYINGTVVTKSDWMKIATEDDIEELKEYEVELCDSNYATAINFVR